MSQSQLTSGLEGDNQVELKVQSGENSQLFMENSLIQQSFATQNGGTQKYQSQVQ
jgi:hypothetical protein